MTCRRFIVNMMDPKLNLMQQFETYGVGRRKLDDPLFADDEPLKRLGIYDVDDEKLCHEVVTSACQIPGCRFVAGSLLEFENHYNASHRYSCSQCKKVLPSPHLLDLHIQEKHDSFFAVMAAKKPSYCCYIEECKERFLNAEVRLEHCVKIHKLPKDFRFEQKPKASKSKKHRTKDKGPETCRSCMEVDEKETPRSVEGCSMDVDANNKEKLFRFSNSKHKAFAKYTGKKFTGGVSGANPTSDVNIDRVVQDLKQSLP